MILTRAQLAKMFASYLAVGQISDPQNTGSEVRRRYHDPPPGVSYEENSSVFGRILDGTLPCAEFRETDTTLTFRDRSPRAPLHALVIPKKFIPSVFELDPGNDLELLKEMKEEALATLQAAEPKSFEEKDYILAFHLPPFNSVDHLHLHVLAPASEMNVLYRNVKYQPGTLWCTDFDTVLDALSAGKLMRR
jgi:diadenosine tetraphosphate (Ap4A) HIT family hydrolase